MIIGLDVGGTNIKGVLINGRKVIAKIKVATKSRTDKKILVNQILSCIDGLKNKASKIEKIGIGIAGPIDFKKQTVLNPPNLIALRGLKLGKLVQDKFGIKTIIEHDVNCFVLVEAILGAGKNYKSVFGITLGTGVGGGMVIDKKIYRGAHGSSGEVGHMTIEKNGRQCKCGNKGCLEPYICDTGIKQTAKQIFKKQIDSLRIFDDLAKKGDKRAIKLYETVGKYLGIGLANIVDTINPEVIVIGGGIMRAGKFILNPAKKEMKKNILSQSAKKTKILKSKLGKFAGAIGATLLTL
ncbi:MAG: ROK family protein [bacterium]|nr:ROK family protein [bacterium]